MHRNALVETDGTPEVITIIQVFIQLFLQAYQNGNKQVSQDLCLIFLQKCKISQEKAPILLLREVTEYK